MCFFGEISSDCTNFLLPSSPFHLLFRSILSFINFIHLCQINNQPVPWSTPAGQSLKQSLVLSPNAKKFALCRELVSVNSNEPLELGTLAAATVSMVRVCVDNID